MLDMTTVRELVSHLADPGTSGSLVISLSRPATRWCLYAASGACRTGFSQDISFYPYCTLQGGPALVIRSHSGDPDCPLCRLDLDLPLDDQTIELVVASVAPCCIRLLLLRPWRPLLLTSVLSSTAVVVSTLVPRAASTLHTRFAD